MSDSFKAWWETEGSKTVDTESHMAVMMVDAVMPLIKLAFVSGEAVQAQKAVDQMAVLLEDEV